MIINHPDMEVIKHSNLEYSDKQLKLYSLCKEFVHAKITSQHFITKNNGSGFILFYTVEGQGMVFTQGELKGLKHNDLCLINMNESFYISSNYWEFIYVYLDSDNMKLIIEDNFNENLFGIKDNTYIENQFYFLNDCMEGNNVLMISSSVQRLIFDILKNKIDNHVKRINMTPIDLAIKYIEDNFSDDISVDFLCKYIGLSKYHFIRLFKEVTNNTPYNYLLQVRLDYAKFLLRYTNNHINEIAIKSGFKNEMSFYQNFVKNLGVAPSRYRKNIRGVKKWEKNYYLK